MHLKAESVAVSRFWGSTKDNARRAEHKVEAKFNRWGERVNESVEDTKRTAQVHLMSMTRWVFCFISVHSL